MALEDYYLLGRHSCGECSDRQRQRIGCKKPGANVEGHDPPFRLESPQLYEREIRNGTPGALTIINECPTGSVLREAPHVLRAFAAANDVENGARPLSDLAAWGQSAVSVVLSERGRLRESSRTKQEEQSRQRRDSSTGLRVMMGHGRG